MAQAELTRVRRLAGLSQQAAAARLGLSQPYYSQIEGGARSLPSGIAARIVREFGATPSILPLPPLTGTLPAVAADRLTSALAALGYPPFVHFRKFAEPMNPALVLVGGLVHSDLDVRIVESLPWVLMEFVDLDMFWLAAQCRLQNLQNRLGYLVSLLRPSRENMPHLSALLFELERSRLAGEGTLCRDSMPPAERAWVRKHRSSVARHWALLTTLTREQLPYAT